MDPGNEWKSEYLKDNFAVNATLSKCTQKKDLNEVTENLKLYASELHESMTEILKEETEPIVILAQALSGLSLYLNKLTIPLTQFREEIFGLFELISVTENICKQHLIKSKHLHTDQHYTSLISSISNIAEYVEAIVQKQIEDSGIDLQLFERAIDEYSINVNHLKASKTTDTTENIINPSLEEKLKILTDNKFIQGIKNRDDKTVYSCLRAYVSLNRQEDAELLYKTTFVDPVLSLIFNLKNLENHNFDLNELYKESEAFKTKEMSFLFNILDKNHDLKGFNFTINSYWKSADRLLRDNLSQTTSSGNPELFQKRFQATFNFLTSINFTLKDASFHDHMKRFNLAVYFEIRHQQISASFEKDLVENESLNESLNTGADTELKLKATLAFWRSINHCFHPDIYLNHLCDQFFKLSMLLQGRYLKYINVMAEKSVKEAGSEEFLINCLLDIKLLKKLLGEEIKDNLKESIYKIVHKNFEALIKKAVVCNEKIFNNTYDNVVNQLININIEKGKILLQQVGSIPRLYRRTNKSAPTEPSSYVLEIVKPIVTFHNNYIDILKDDVLQISNISVDKIAKQYLTVIQDVLHSICKTEESLRRLKSRNISVETSQNVDLTSDEAKIREQIRLDVAYFLSILGKLVFDPENDTLKALKKESDCRS
ncbi:conserved oligomeric Golgi complex subunit 2 [Onthophagus taurus]|uniref:conserved oligomeric Golgi complex subunit 2 n=1 Tax=Onthophagus taurus TaxID=166361 RepID=UPI0039BDA64D